MKSIYYLIIVFISLVILGCSSTYTIKDFSSKEKFYDDFNNSAKYKNIEVQFVNDSSLTIDNGAIIIRDTLYALGFRTHKKFGSIAISKIKNIDYITSDYKSANLLLANGEQISVEDISIANDTLKYSETKKILTRTKVSLLDGIKKVSYKNHLLGIPSGFLIGAVSGFGVSYILDHQFVNKNDPDKQSSKNIFIYIAGVPLGALTGIIWGWLNGYTYTYQFNP